MEGHTEVRVSQDTGESQDTLLLLLTSHLYHRLASVHSVPKDDLELLTLLPPPPDHLPATIPGFID